MSWNPFLNIWIKVFLLTWVFFVLINFFGYLISADFWDKNIPRNNSENFTRWDVGVIWHVGVALTTNIWTRFKERQELPISIYNEVMDIWYIIANKNEASDKLISKNMIAVQEYLNVLKVDVKDLLNRSNDRAFALESYISQLEYRLKSSKENQKLLNIQKNELTKIHSSANKSIEENKRELEMNFWNFNHKASIENINEYLENQKENIYSRTYIILINKFLEYYSMLDDYNIRLINTLKVNKEALIKNSRVVIPQTWWELLKDLNLLLKE